MGHKRAQTYLAETKGEKSQREAYTEGVKYFQDLLSQPDAGWQDFMSGTSQPAWDEARRRAMEQQTQQTARSGFSSLRHGPDLAAKAEIIRMMGIGQGTQEAKARMNRFGRVEEGAHGKGRNWSGQAHDPMERREAE